MVVTCPACGRASRDLEFCDHCNVDLAPSSVVFPPPLGPLPEGPLPLAREQVALLGRPEAAVSVQYRGRFWRLHWIPHSHWLAWHASVEERRASRAAALPPLR